jgi:hypothetical protein
MKKMILGGAMLALAATAAVAMVPNAGMALAQSLTDAPIDGVVNIPWGDWFYEGASAIITVLGMAIAWGLRHLPARLVALAQTLQVEQLLRNAVEFGINRTAGAVKGQALPVPIANKVLEQALEYAVKYAPGWLLNWVGGEEGVKDKLIARIPVAKEGAI